MTVLYGIGTVLRVILRIALLPVQAVLTLLAYSARTAHPFRRNGAPFRFKLSKAQLVD